MQAAVDEAQADMETAAEEQQRSTPKKIGRSQVAIRNLSVEKMNFEVAVRKLESFLVEAQLVQKQNFANLQ